MIKNKILLTAVMVMMSHGAALANFDNPTSYYEEKEEASPWSVSLGAGVGYGPAALGSERKAAYVLPIFSIQYKDWHLGNDGLSYNVISFKDHFVLNVGVGYDSGRNADDFNTVVSDIDGGAVLNINSSFYLTNWLDVEVNISKSNSEAKSLRAVVGAGVDLPLSENFIFDMGVDATWANKDHMEAYYGVDASSGIESVSTTIGGSYIFDDNWMLNMNGGVEFLQGEAADSLIVEEETHPFVYSALIYTF